MSLNSTHPSRRKFLTLSASGLVSAMASAATEPGFSMPSTRVDTHTHFYDPTRPEGVPWPPEASPLYRRVLPEDWKKEAAPCGVHHTIVVEASNRVEDNQWILDLATHDPSIVGYVGNLDPMSESFSEHLKRFSANPVLKGLRVSERMLVQHGSHPTFLRAMQQIADLGLSLDVNGSYRFLKPLHEVVKAVPQLRIMVDHMGGPGDAKQLSAEWRQGMEWLGQQAQVYCKISGIPGQSAKAWGEAPTAQSYYEALFDHVWACFGEDRCVYGSDWPVSERGMPYARMFDMIVEEVKRRPRASQVADKWFCENSRRFYRWQLRK